MGRGGQTSAWVASIIVGRKTTPQGLYNEKKLFLWDDSKGIGPIRILVAEEGEEKESPSFRKDLKK